MIAISPLLCARPSEDGAGSAATSTPSSAPSPVIPSRVIRSVRRYLIAFVVVAVVVVVVVVVALKISTLRTSYHQLPPPNQKIGFVSFFACPI